MKPTNLQKYSWKVVGKYPDFPSADSHRNQLKEQGKHVKVHLMGKGTYYAVKTGTKIKKENQGNQEKEKQA